MSEHSHLFKGPVEQFQYLTQAVVFPRVDWPIIQRIFARRE